MAIIFGAALYELSRWEMGRFGGELRNIGRGEIPWAQIGHIAIGGPQWQFSERAGGRAMRGGHPRFSLAPPLPLFGFG